MTPEADNQHLTVVGRTYSSTTEYPMPVVLSTLRVAHKYQSDHLRDMALTCLKTKMPMDLANISVLLNMSRRVAPPFIDYIFEILDTALDLGMQSIIPLACLLCIRFMKLVRSRNLLTLDRFSFVSFLLLQDQILDNHTHSNGSIKSLSPEACKLILKGWQSLTVAAIYSTLHEPMTRRYPISEHCTKQFLVDISPEDSEVYDCGVDGRAVQQRVRAVRIAENPANAFVLGSVELCPFCAPSIDVDYFRDRDELWDRLPSFFGLPHWNQLKDFYP